MAPELAPQSCETYTCFSNVGHCSKYLLPVGAKELCDSYFSIHQFGRR